VGYGTVRKDSPFQGLNTVSRRIHRIMGKEEKYVFYRNLESGKLGNSPFFPPDGLDEGVSFRRK
jgi:hypothetical protein